MIRQSGLKGFKIDGIEERVIVSLFADDTLVYLHENDKLEELTKILDTFCEASTAKFNLNKTEYLPIGSPLHRDRVKTTGLLNKDQEIPVPKDTIKGDASPMRTLGCWVGYNIDITEKWKKIENNQEATIAIWDQINPSLYARPMVIKGVVESQGHFLTRVNTCPPHIAKRMNYRARTFLWRGKKRGHMPFEEIIAPRSIGGLDFPDMEARAEAMILQKFQNFAAPASKRPRWAWVYDQLINKSIPEKPKVDPESRISWLLQNWHESTTKAAKLPYYILKMLRVARKWNVGLRPLKLTTEVKEEMPIWHH
ncbi:hypothetical protein NEOLEDRAFT_1081776, partial [Neolentinus lepideus HHB14362 ss-1]